MAGSSSDCGSRTAPIKLWHSGFFGGGLGEPMPLEATSANQAPDALHVPGTLHIPSSSAPGQTSCRFGPPEPTLPTGRSRRGCYVPLPLRNRLRLSHPMQGDPSSHGRWFSPPKPLTFWSAQHVRACTGTCSPPSSADRPVPSLPSALADINFTPVLAFRQKTITPQ